MITFISSHKNQLPINFHTHTTHHKRNFLTPTKPTKQPQREAIKRAKAKLPKLHLVHLFASAVVFINRPTREELKRAQKHDTPVQLPSRLIKQQVKERAKKV
jgi:hypothetical protein